MALLNAQFTRVLGVIVSPDLAFSEHIHVAVESAGILVSSIFRCLAVTTPDLYVRLLNTIVIPEQLYAVLIWNPQLQKHGNLLGRVRTTFIERLTWRCWINKAVVDVSELESSRHKADVNLLICLVRAGLLEDLFHVKHNSLRSGISISRTKDAKTDVMNGQFIWRACRLVQSGDIP